MDEDGNNTNKPITDISPIRIGGFGFSYKPVRVFYCLNNTAAIAPINNNDMRSFLHHSPSCVMLSRQICVAK